MRNVQYIVLILSVYEIAGHTTLRENESLETQDTSPRTTSVRISSNLRDVLNQESLVRFSMVQQIQKLAMDVTEIKKDKQTLKRNLNDVMSKLQALEINNERLRQENDMLKENDIARETGKGNRNLGFNMSDILTMQRQISVLENNSDGLAMENANLREKVGFLETTGMMRIRNECRANNQKYHNLLKENDDFKLKLRIMNDTLSQTRELGEKTEDRIQNLKISTEVSLNDIREDLKVSQLQLQNISAEIWKECEGGWQQFGDSCYHFSDTAVKFNDAVKMCNNVSRGARLLEIRSLEQENWIISQVEMQGLERTWMGITDSLDEGTYLFLSTDSRVNGTYSNWYKNQPSGGRGENCGVLVLRTYKGWHDYPCDSKHSYICKKARF